MANKTSMRVESYIVRIYRRGRGEVLVGVVETAASGWQKPFRNISELTVILSAPKRRASRKAQTPDIPLKEGNHATARNSQDEQEGNRTNPFQINR